MVKDKGFSEGHSKTRTHSRKLPEQPGELRLSILHERGDGRSAGENPAMDRFEHPELLCWLEGTLGVLVAAGCNPSA